MSVEHVTIDAGAVGFQLNDVIGGRLYNGCLLWIVRPLAAFTDIRKHTPFREGILLGSAFVAVPSVRAYSIRVGTLPLLQFPYTQHIPCSSQEFSTTSLPLVTRPGERLCWLPSHFGRGEGQVSGSQLLEIIG